MLLRHIRLATTCWSLEESQGVALAKCKWRLHAPLGLGGIWFLSMEVKVASAAATAVAAAAAAAVESAAVEEVVVSAAKELLAAKVATAWHGRDQRPHTLSGMMFFCSMGAGRPLPAGPR